MSDSSLDLSDLSPHIDWNVPLRAMNSTPTLQVVVNPLLKRGSPIHDRAFEELRKLGAENVRFVPWFPYPRYSIAELQAPAEGQTSWDFSQIDPFTVDFLEATQGHAVTLNFSTIPPWMFKIDQPPVYPDDPDQTAWFYQLGHELRDPSLQELSDYFARLVSWYTQGGFVDELGARHESGHHYNVAYWEVLNEPDFEHDTSPKQYTERYDAIVSAIRKVNPQIKFIGLSLALPGRSPDFFEYFLNPQNHQAGIPLDMISYHFYAVPALDESWSTRPFTCFTQADGFITMTRYVETIRQRLSPTTQTTINEVGVILSEDMLQSGPDYVFEPFPASYWNLAAGIYAYLFAHLATLGIEFLGESQLVGYPTQFPSVSMVDWETGGPNARLRVLELLKKHFAPGGSVMRADSGAPFPVPYYHAQGFVNAAGQRQLLLINKRDIDLDLKLEGFSGAVAEIVDQVSAGGPARIVQLDGEALRLPALAVAVVTLAAAVP
jgi:hypothetical protein